MVVLVAMAALAMEALLATPAGSGHPAEALPSPLSTNSADQQNDAEEPGERVPAGTAWSLSLNPSTRAEAAKAARNAGASSAAEIAAGGRLYYGAVYGQTEAEDVYYVLALLDRVYFWTKNGTAPWHYQGDYEAHSCVAPVPTKLYLAWGLSFSTEAAGQTPCPIQGSG